MRLSLIESVSPNIYLNREVFMVDISTLFLCIAPILNRTLLKQLTIIAEAIFCMNGRVTMLGISRWSGKGGSYRTIQRFYNSVIPWCNVQWLFIRRHLLDIDDTILIAADETTVTKSGKSTCGLGRFFSSIYNRAVPGLGFFSISLISVKRQKAYPVLMEQLDPAQKRATKSGNHQKKKNGRRGRPKGSRNRNHREVELSAYLIWIQSLIRKIMTLIGKELRAIYFVYDGAFGNNPCLQMTEQCGLHLISKLNCNSALYFPYNGPYSGRGPYRKYGEKLTYSGIPGEYLIKASMEDNILTEIYQMRMWHKAFPRQLNVTVIRKVNLSKEKEGRVILFSSDPDLAAENMILYYRLRFQIEFTFRDAKQHWGLEDFMNVKEQPVKNAANLAMFMVNCSQAHGRTIPLRTQFSVNDIKARFHAFFYIRALLKKTPQIEDPVFIRQLYENAESVGAIHQQLKVA